MQETRVWFLGQEDPLEKEMATHSSILTWRIPWTEEPSRVTVHGVSRVRCNLATKPPPPALLPRSKQFFISWLQSPSRVNLEPMKIKSVTVSTFSLSLCHEVMGPNAMILVFKCWVLSQLFHSPLSSSSRGSWVPFHFLPLEWYHLHIYCYFSRQSWFQLVIHPAQNFIWLLSFHVLLKSTLKDFEHNLTSMQNELYCPVVQKFFGTALLWDWNENWPFLVPWPLPYFPNLLACWVQCFNSIIFLDLKRLSWNSITSTSFVCSNTS